MVDTHTPAEWERYYRGALDMIANKVGKIDAVVEATRKLEEQHMRLESSITKMADAVTKLAVIEERQAQDRKEMADLRSALAEIVRKHDASAERVMQAVERLDDRVNALEKTEPMNAQTRRWVIGALGLLATIFVYAIANLLGLKA